MFVRQTVHGQLKGKSVADGKEEEKEEKGFDKRGLKKAGKVNGERNVIICF